MAEITVDAPAYGPKASDEHPSSYLLRCAEGLAQDHGYDCTIHLGGSPVRQLQINVPDASAPGNGKRPVTVMPPQVVVDINGAVQVFADATAAVAAYPSLAADLDEEA